MFIDIFGLHSAILQGHEETWNKKQSDFIPTSRMSLWDF